MIASIYKITNKVNDKIYIGFTKNKFSLRINQHICMSKNQKYKSIFHAALNKYGKENFHWEIIYQSKDINHTLNIMEPYFIKQYNSIENGYNISKGGEGPIGRPSKFKGIKTGNIPWNKGKKCPEISERMKGVKNHQYGLKKKNTEQENKRIKSLCKKVWKFYSPNKELIQFYNLGEFCRNNNLRTDAMNRVHSGKYSNHRGWTKFIEENDKLLHSD